MCGKGHFLGHALGMLKCVGKLNITIGKITLVRLLFIFAPPPSDRGKKNGDCFIVGKTLLAPTYFIVGGEQVIQ